MLWVIAAILILGFLGLVPAVLRGAAWLAVALIAALIGAWAWTTYPEQIASFGSAIGWLLTVVLGLGAAAMAAAMIYLNTRALWRLTRALWQLVRRARGGINLSEDSRDSVYAYFHRDRQRPRKPSSAPKSSAADDDELY